LKGAGGPWAWTDYEALDKAASRDWAIQLRDLCVLDVDSGPLAELLEARHPALAAAPCVRTRRGYHYYFRCPPAVDVPALYWDGCGQRPPEGACVAFKSALSSTGGTPQAGVIVAPPSTDKRWVRAPWDAASPVTDLPVQLLDAVAHRARTVPADEPPAVAAAAAGTVTGADGVSHPEPAAASAPPAGMAVGAAAPTAAVETGCSPAAAPARPLTPTAAPTAAASTSASTSAAVAEFSATLMVAAHRALTAAADGTNGADAVAAMAALPAWVLAAAQELPDFIRLSDDDMPALCAVLRGMPQLKILNLRSNLIGDAGAVALAEALHSLPQLTSLWLSDNDIGDAGAVALAEALPSLPQLTALSLHGNSIGEAGARAVAEALHSLPQLQILSLHGNRIGEAGARMVAEALRGVPLLEYLSLQVGDSGVGDAGGAALAVRTAAPAGCRVHM